MSGKIDRACLPLHDTPRSFGSQRNFLANILKQELVYEETKARTLLAFYRVSKKMYLPLVEREIKTI